MKGRTLITQLAEACLFISLLLVFVGVSGPFTQTGHAKESAHKLQVFDRPLFRYAIIYNDPALNGAGRDLHILMDPSEFDEANLRRLFVLLSERFRDLPGFTAYIETSLQDIQTPEEHEGPGYSEAPGNPKGGKGPAATIRHSAQADSLYIYVPSRATNHPKKVDLSGVAAQ